MYENEINPFRIICLHLYTTLNLSAGNKVKKVYSTESIKMEQAYVYNFLCHY